MTLSSKLSGAALGALLTFGITAGAAARPLTPAEQRTHGYASKLPLCHDAAVLGKIASRLSARETEYWSSGLAIVSYDHVREVGFRSAGLDYIPRRHCNAAAVMTDGKVRRVTYAIGEDLGIIGWGWGVEWCIAGLDRNLAHGANCKAAGP